MLCLTKVWLFCIYCYVWSKTSNFGLLDAMLDSLVDTFSMKHIRHFWANVTCKATFLSTYPKARIIFPRVGMPEQRSRLDFWAWSPTVLMWRWMQPGGLAALLQSKHDRWEAKSLIKVTGKLSFGYIIQTNMKQSSSYICARHSASHTWQETVRCLLHVCFSATTSHVLLCETNFPGPSTACCTQKCR